MIAGIELWYPEKPPTYEDGMPIFELIGTDAQIVQFPVRAGRQVMCFSGAMAYMSDGMKMECRLAGLKKTFGRLVGGGSLFEITYTNESGVDGFIGMTPDYPGVIVPIHMANVDKLYCLRDSFLCSTVDLGKETTDVSAGFNPARNIGAACCSGFDLIVQTLQQGDWAFIMAMGTVVTKTLQAGESMLVDGDSLLCFEGSVEIDVRSVGNCAAMCCGGDGLFHTELHGPGKIWLQSLSIDKMRHLFPPKVASNNAAGGDGGDGGGFDFSG
eukprot:CAMPEP_0119552072 /NCGR_PEP_ID=MMETSP1352-20130426/5169_1 /TAXON_ID=265584 /ORGANISM="Stauroneis constricta, Strain CCMP1120" /LENGTH=269 /DNA_ID=CAMNT_0007598245 /DNA_START=66 /DNA_END=875 /DNA_ORIENTATION=-